MVVVDTEVNIYDHDILFHCFISSRFHPQSILHSHLNSVTHIMRINLPPCSSSCCIDLDKQTNCIQKGKTNSPRLRGEIMKINLWIIHLLECWHTKWGERCSSKKLYILLAMPWIITLVLAAKSASTWREGKQTLLSKKVVNWGGTIHDNMHCCVQKRMHKKWMVLEWLLINIVQH